MQHQLISLYTELIEFIATLHELGKEDLLCLISITQVVQADLDFNWRVPLLSKIFAELPNYLQRLMTQGYADLHSLLVSPPSDMPHFRLLLDMHKILPILYNLSYTTLLIITGCMPIGSSAAIQYQMLLKLQGVFLSWSNSNVRSYTEVITATPVHLEREKLLELDPSIPLDIIPMIIKLLKIEVEELLQLKLWIQNLQEIDFIIMANLFQFDQTILTKLKRQFSHLGLGRRNDLTASLPASSVGNISNKNTLKRPRDEDPQLRTIEDPMSRLSVSTALSPPSDVVASYTAGADNSLVDTVFDQCFETNVNNEDDPIIIPSTPPTMTIPLSPPSMVVAKTPPSPSPIQKMVDVKPNYSVVPYHTPPIPVPQTSLARVESLENFSLQSQPPWVLKVIDKGQPPSQTVYQRILRPFPAVILLPPVSDKSRELGLFVEASLIRSDNNTELPSFLDGTKIIRIEPGKMANFNKLKILYTTQQIGSLVKIKFQLKKAHEGNFINIPGVVTVSRPIEVFSHSYYIPPKRSESTTTPPVVTEVLPARGPVSGGTRIAILGDNFMDTPNLRLRFGNIILRPTFHESRTLISTVPPGFPGTVSISVSNDGKDYSTVQAQYTYD